jgi:hypothetical protein
MPIPEALLHLIFHPWGRVGMEADSQGLDGERVQISSLEISQANGTLRPEQERMAKKSE